MLSAPSDGFPFSLLQCQGVMHKIRVAQDRVVYESLSISSKGAEDSTGTDFHLDARLPGVSSVRRQLGIGQLFEQLY